MRSPRKILTLTLTGLAVALAACGGDDEKTSSGSSSSSSEPAKLAITATGSSESPSYEVAAETPAGVTEITLTNDGKGEIDGQLVRIDGDHEVSEVLAELEKAQGGKPVQDWFQAKGGVPSTAAGESATVTQVLEPGTYYLLGGEDKPKGDPSSFTVTGEASDGELPAAEGGKVGAGEYSFFGGPVKSGAPIEFDNTGKQWHHFIALPLNAGATVEDAKAFFKSEGKGKPPFDPENSFETTVMDGGVSQVVDANIPANKYVLVCFLSDRKGGPPHFTKGMVSELEVQ